MGIMHGLSRGARGIVRVTVGERAVGVPGPGV